MSDPWEEVSLQDYENYMKLSTVQHLQTLNRIMKSQIYKYKSRATTPFMISNILTSPKP